jgi:hypothetical protein
MSGHALLSPSRAVRFMRCPGSVREESKYPEKPSGPGAVDGTHSHTLLEHCVKADLVDPMIMVGVKMKDHEGEFVIDAERAKRVKSAVDYVKQKVETLSFMFGVPAKVLAERRVNPEFLLGRADMMGTVDVTIICGAYMEIIDLKDGMNPVQAKDNEQLEMYALGALADYKLPINVEYPIKTMRLTIIQPKIALKGMEPITTHDLTIQEVLGLIPKYVAGGAATEAPDAPLIPGDKQCKYCRAAGCSARASQSMAAAGVVFPSLTPVVDAPTQVAVQDPGAMTNERLCEIIEAAPLMRQMIEQAEAEAQRRLEMGQSINGLKLVNGRGSQAWALAEDQIAEKLKGMGLPKDAIWFTKLISPAQAKKVTWAKRDGTTKQLTERQLKTMETEYIVKMGGKLTVAPMSDPRPAVVRDAAPLFAAVDQAPALPSWMSS